MTTSRSPGRWPGRSTSSRARSSTPGWSSAPSTAARRSAGSGSASVDATLPADRVSSSAPTARTRWSAPHLGLPYGRRALAIRGYAPTPPDRRGTQVIRYGDRRQPAYAWAFDRGDGLSNVGYGELLPSDGDGDPPSRALLLDQLEQLLPGSVDAGEHWKGHHLPLSGWRWEQPDGRLLLTGDAAGLINPMTGEGIYYAIATGIAAGRSAVRALRDGGDAGALHRQAVRAPARPAPQAHLRRVPARRVPGDRRRRHPGGPPGPKVFDELVELGLGDGRISGRLVGGLATGLGRKAVSRVRGRWL